MSGSLDDLSPTAAVTAPRIVFVCTENAARSPLAAAMWTHRSPVPSASAGTHPAARVHRGALAAARRHDVPRHPQSSCALDEVVRAGDVVITVCDRAHEELPVEMAHHHWSIADPATPGTADAFDRAVGELADRIARFAPAVHPAEARSA